MPTTATMLADSHSEATPKTEAERLALVRAFLDEAFTLRDAASFLAGYRAAVAATPQPKERPSRAASAAVGPFAPDTGDRDLDAWMLANRSRRGAPKPRRVSPSPRLPFGLKKLTDGQRLDVLAWNDTAIRSWRSRGYNVTVVPVDGASANSHAVALDGRNVSVVGLVQ